MIPFRPNIGTREIVFVRHAESQANADGIWNGQTDGPLSLAGEASLAALSDRLSDWEFSKVVSSPLERTRRTAGAFADDIELDPEFLELDMGEWEGRRFEEIQSEDGEQLRRAVDDPSIPMGRTGESLDQLARRALRAVDRLFHSLDDGEVAAVVTHGGLLQSVLHRHMAGHGTRAHAFTQNTAITRIKWQFGRPRLATFNDVSHLGPRSKLMQAHLDSGDQVFTFIRHGQTNANVEGRWQGQGDWDLNEVGQEQAKQLGDWYGTWDHVYASPLKRASSTAAKVAANGFETLAGLKELNMGAWEGLTTPEIQKGWPDVMETIFRDGVDLRRGVTGESWGELASRFANTVDSLPIVTGEPVVVVSHGGAIRAYVSSLTKTSDTHAESLFTPVNTSVSHVALTERGPEILDYSVAPHVETLQ